MSRRAESEGTRRGGGIPVRLTLYAGFALIAVLVAGYAAWGVRALGEAEAIVERTFDRSMTALNATRAAEAAWSALQDAPSADETALLDELIADLDVVADRAPGEASAHAAAMSAELASWRGAPLPEGADARMRDAFLVLSEHLAADAYIEREAAIGAVAASTRGARIGLALVIVTAVVTAILLSLLIVTPLTGAARAARRISEGDLSAPLPKGSGAEVRALLASMDVMQASIARMIANEKARAATAEAMLAGAVAQAADGIVLVDGDDRVLLANGPAEALAGVPLTKGAGLADVLGGTDLSTDAVEVLMIGGEAALEGERWVKASPPGAAGQDNRILIWSDITQIRAREAALAAANAAKSRFMATISHELKTPLNAVIGFSDLLRSEAMGPLGDESYKGFAGEIHTAGSGLLTIISDILGFANAQGADYAADGDDVDAARLCERVADSVRGDEGFAGVTVTVRAEPGLPQLTGREVHLTRALGHLADNAAHFAAKGGGHVRLAACRTEAGIAIMVADDGPGMTPEELSRAQGVFDQVDGSLTRQHEGLGLGLPLARSIVEAHGGTLTIDSARGGGTVATMTLPVRPRRAEAA